MASCSGQPPSRHSSMGPRQNQHHWPPQRQRMWLQPYIRRTAVRHFGQRLIFHFLRREERSGEISSSGRQGRSGWAYCLQEAQISVEQVGQSTMTGWAGWMAGDGEMDFLFLVVA